MTDKCLHCSCFIFLTMFCLSVESCAELEFITPVSDTLNIVGTNDINVTFKLNMENCADQNYTVTIETFQQKVPEIHCKIVFTRTSCSLTDKSHEHCRCRNNHVEFWKKVEKAGDVVYTWRWFTTDSNTAKGERCLKFRFPDLLRTSEQENENDHLPYVIGAVCGLLLLALLFVIVFSYQRKLRHSNSNVDRKPETPRDQTTETQIPNEEIPSVPGKTGSEKQNDVGEYIRVPEDTYSEAWDHTTMIPPGVIPIPREGGKNPAGGIQIPAGAVRVLVDMKKRRLSPD